MYRPKDDPPWEGNVDEGERLPIAPKGLLPPPPQGERLSKSPKWARDREWLREVAMTPERDLRGHRITLTYHALAIDLYQWIYDVRGPVSQDGILGQVPAVNANWFNFSTWATATLNADIRNDDPPYRSDRMVPPGFYRRLTPTLLAIKSANRQRYNQLLTWYQRMVFINTTFAYSAARAFETSNPGEDFAKIENGVIRVKPQEWMDKAQALVRPRDGEPALQRERHLEPVAMAMQYYKRARDITRYQKARRRDQRIKGVPKKPTQTYLDYLRARLIFLGNLIITSVEQDVVDPGVERVLNNVPIAAGDYVSNHLARLAQRTLGVPRQLAGLRIPVKLQPAEDVFQEMWVRLLTRELLVLAMPAETLRLGHDIPPIAAGKPFYPEELFDLRSLPDDEGLELPRDGYVGNTEQHRVDNLDLLRTVDAFDRSEGDGCGTGARDWRRITERLNWATTLIRSRIQDASLFWPPFRNEDVYRIYRGKLPLHAGNPTDFDVLGPLESFPYLCGRGHDKLGDA
jgi:hypothetical protein